MKDLGADENGTLLSDNTKSIGLTATCVRVYRTTRVASAIRLVPPLCASAAMSAPSPPLRQRCWPQTPSIPMDLGRAPQSVTRPRHWCSLRRSKSAASRKEQQPSIRRSFPSKENRHDSYINRRIGRRMRRRLDRFGTSSLLKKVFRGGPWQH
jgi:hypothetical protein